MSHCDIAGTEEEGGDMTEVDKQAQVGAVGRAFQLRGLAGKIKEALAAEVNEGMVNGDFSRIELAATPDDCERVVAQPGIGGGEVGKGPLELLAHGGAGFAHGDADATLEGQFFGNG